MNAGGVPNTCKSNGNTPACRGKYSGARVSNTWAICLRIRDNAAKAALIPDDIAGTPVSVMKDGLCTQAVVRR